MKKGENTFYEIRVETFIKINGSCICDVFNGTNDLRTKTQKIFGGYKRKLIKVH